MMTKSKIYKTELERALTMSAKVDENRGIITAANAEIEAFEKGSDYRNLTKINRELELLDIKDPANADRISALKNEGLRITTSEAAQMYKINKSLVERLTKENENLVSESKDLLTICGDLSQRIVDGRRVTVGDTLKLIGVLVPVGISAVMTGVIAAKTLELDENGKLSLTAFGKLFFSGKGGLLKL